MSDKEKLEESHEALIDAMEVIITPRGSIPSVNMLDVGEKNGVLMKNSIELQEHIDEKYPNE